MILKKEDFLGLCRKQWTPPTHPHGLGLPKVKKFSLKNYMPYKHDIVFFSLQSLRPLTPTYPQFSSPPFILLIISLIITSAIIILITLILIITSVIIIIMVLTYNILFPLCHPLSKLQICRHLHRLLHSQMLKS